MGRVLALWAAVLAHDQHTPCALCTRSTSLDRVRELTGAGEEQLRFIKGDVNSGSDLDAAFASDTFTSVIHFAALKVRQLVLRGQVTAQLWVTSTPTTPHSSCCGATRAMRVMRVW